MAETDGDEVVEIAAGYDLGSVEVVLAHLRGDGIEARLEPSDLAMVMDDESGYRILLRRADLEAARPVLEAAEIEVP